MNNKQQSMLLFKQAMKFFIDELLTDYFNFVSYKIMLYFACLEKKTELIDNIIEILKKSQLKKSLKSNLSFKIYLLLKYCF